MKINGLSRRGIWRRLKIAVVVSVLVFGLSRVLLEWDWFAVRVTSDQTRLAQIAMESGRVGISVDAVENLEDQTLLAQIAMGPYGSASRYAIDKLEDQVVLAQLAMEGRYSEFRLAAVLRLKDQNVLARIAATDKAEDIRRLAFEKLQLNDQALATMVAVAAKDRWVRESACKKLEDQELLVRISVEDQDEKVRQTSYRRLMDLSPDFTKLSTSIDEATTRLYANVLQQIHTSSVPEEHREHLYIGVSRALRVLTNSPIVEELGTVEDIGVQWKPLSESYLGLGLVQGEWIKLSLKLKKVKSLVQHVWATEFPYSIEWNETELPPKWWFPGIDAGSLYSELSSHLSQSTHAWVACELDDSTVRRAAVERLEDQSLIARIAVEDDDMWVCDAAMKRLFDQQLLAKIAVERQEIKYWSIRKTAVEKLTEQTLLAKLALEDEDETVRGAATANLTNQVLLARIAVEDEDWTVRKAAVEKLRTPFVVGMPSTKSQEQWKEESNLADEIVWAKDRSDRKVAVEKLVEMRIEAQSKVGKNP